MKKLALFLLTFLYMGTASAQTVHSGFHDGILSFKTLVDSGTSLPLYPNEGTYPYVDSLIDKYGVNVIKKTFPESENPHLAGMYDVSFDSLEKADALVNDLKVYGFVEYACKIPIKRPFASPKDPKYSLQWGLHKIMADSLWHLLDSGGKEIKNCHY